MLPRSLLTKKLLVRFHKFLPLELKVRKDGKGLSELVRIGSV